VDLDILLDQQNDYASTFFFTALRYASAVYAMALCPSVCMSVSVTSRSSIETAERIQLFFCMEAFFDVSYTVL